MKPIQIGDVVGDYRVVDIAGSGGMGAVYKIEHVITRRIEAMKLLPPSSCTDPEQVHRFEREIQVQARLHHPNIVALYNAVRDGDLIALVMEFVEGESLQRKLESGPLSVETATDYAGQILRALAYAHDAGVIHRDVAPANVIVTPDGVVKLMDFGLARGAGDLRLSTSGVPVGSPWYMSPEQVKAIGPMDARVDIYATGAVLHEMLTGAKLFDGEGAFAVMRAHVESTPAPPSSRNPAVSAALDEIVQKAVAKDPALRFQSADEFRLALQQSTVEGHPIVVPPIPRRRKSLRMVLAASVVTAAICSIRLFPGAGHVTAPARRPQPAPAATSQSSPPPAPPSVAAVQEVLAPAPAVQPDAEKPIAAAPHRPPVAAQSTRPRRADQSSAIRVTGSEPQPAAALSAPSPAPQMAESVEPPETSPVSTPVPELPAAQEPVPSKPPGVGSRLVRALGKVNPFHKSAKHETVDAAKTPLK